MSRRALRIVDAVSALLALSAALLALWPARDRADARTALPASLLAAPTRGARATLAVPGVDSTAAGIVRGNVFSSTRRAPTTRFMPPGAGASGAMADVAEAAPGIDYALPASLPPDSLGLAGGRDPVPSLYGIVGIDGVPHALLGLRSGEPPRLFAVGDRHAGYRISAIERDRVVLVTDRGSRTLRLARSAPRDSSETLP
jgi:hypothetical protein